MRKFAVFSGFLGSGKTTTMMAFTKYYSEHHGKAAMISNDLGHGVNLADNKLALLCGCNASEMTDECICFQHENLVNRLTSYFEDGCDLVLSDIPGFGVGALDHVYHGLAKEYPGQFELAPFTVVVEPETVALLKADPWEDQAHIMNAQLLEADLILLNKSDLLEPATIKEDVNWLARAYPEANVLSISAKEGTGLEELSRTLKTGTASMRRPEVGGQLVWDAMDRISEYYFQYFASVCCNDFDGNAYLLELASDVQEKIRAGGYEVPHLKLLAWEPEGDFGKADLLGANRPIELVHAFEKPCTTLAVILNTSAVCPADKLDEIVTETAKAVSARYNLEMVIHKKECFCLGD